MKKPYLPIFLIGILSGIWIINNSFKTLAIKIAISRHEQPSSKDTNKATLPIYKDSTLYSGYLGNVEPIRKQILNKKHIDNLLKKALPIFYALTKEDKANYILHIDQSDIKTSHDTIIFGKRYLVFSLRVKLANYSTDTLKYLSMDCSWLDSYFTNNNRIKFAKQICFKNEPCVKTILPKHAVSVYIPIIFNRDQNNYSRNFRIGLSLQKFINKSQLLDFDPFIYLLRPETNNMIWSNEVAAL